MYHEKQRYWLCGLHTVNNILQRAMYDRKSMNALCEQLSPSYCGINEHRGLLGLGDYDINVIQQALHLQNLSIIWHDARKSFDENYDQFRDVIAIIVNQKKQNWYNKCLKSRHWFAILKTTPIDVEQVVFWNLDSNLHQPQKMTQYKLIDFLNEQQNQGAQILYVQHEKPN